MDYNAAPHGEREISDQAPSGVIETFSDPRYRLGLEDVQPDFLGRAYEYLLRKFAESQGQSAGEFFTPPEVGLLMAHIIRPRQGEEVCDYACGSAGLLIKCELGSRSSPSARFTPAETLRPGTHWRELRHRPDEHGHPRHGG